MRFAIRAAKLADAEGIARAHTASWRSSYRGILPDAVLDRIDVGHRLAAHAAAALARHLGARRFAAFVEALLEAAADQGGEVLVVELGVVHDPG